MSAFLRADWPAPPGVQALTTLRHGLGVSAPPFDHFNLGARCGDAPEAVAENRRQLAYKPVAMSSGIGRGQVVAFTQDVTMRAFLEGLKPLFLNAVFRGPAHTSGTKGD